MKFCTGGHLADVIKYNNYVDYYQTYMATIDHSTLQTDGRTPYGGNTASVLCA